MAIPPPERRYAAGPDEVFEAARRVVELLGYVPLAIDAEGRILSFSVGLATSFGDDSMTVVVAPDGAGSRVIVTGTGVRSAFVPRGQLTWNGRGPVSSRFLDRLARDLLTPGPSWLADPSRRFAQRWWDGSAWTAATRDHEIGVRYSDPPGSLPPPATSGRSLAR